MAILCGKNPQHVIIYGPPGVGKTCAARLVLEAAKESTVEAVPAILKDIPAEVTQKPRKAVIQQ